MKLHPICQLVLAASLLLLLAQPGSATGASMQELIDQGDVSVIGQALRRGDFTATALTAAYLKRIREHQHLGAVIITNPEVDAATNAADEALAAGDDRPLLGIPVLVKDNIETREMPTTAGSLFLADNQPDRDAAVIKSLREAGAIILGKTNLSEWANFRSRRSSSGWSAVGGQAVNPYDVTRSPCGSSAGSGVAVAARLAPMAVGTETNGSVVCPSHMNGLVGIKPTVGLLAQSGIVPISHSQDTAGPMAVDVRSAALLLSAMAGKELTMEGAATAPGALRLGVMASSMGYHEDVDALFETTVLQLEAAGVTVVRDLAFAPYKEFRQDTFTILKTEFKADLNAYFSSLDGARANATLADLIAFNTHEAARELPHFGQDILIAAEATQGLDDPHYLTALARAQAETRTAIDALLQAHDLDALIAPTGGPAWKIDHVNGDHGLGGFSTYPAVSGYPHITVPMGLVHGLPVGFSLTASAASDARLIGIAAAIERILRVSVQPVSNRIDDERDSASPL